MKIMMCTYTLKNMKGLRVRNKDSTRYFSDLHEKSVCKALQAQQQSNSGAGLFQKGDVVQKEASMLIECKTTMTEKQSVSIKKEWLEKNEKEKQEINLDNSCLCFNFGPNTDNYYVISEKLMKFLIEKLEEDDF